MLTQLIIWLLLSQHIDLLNFFLSVGFLGGKGGETGGVMEIEK